MSLKSKHLLLVFSLSINVLFLLLWANYREPPLPVAIVETSQAIETNLPEAEVPIVTPMNWGKLESEDYRIYIDNLRRIDCPEETIADIIIADVNKIYKQRWQEARQANGGGFEYWKGTAEFGWMSLADRRLYREIDEERRETLKTLLGREVPPKMSDLIAVMYDPWNSFTDFLPESKSAALIEIEQWIGERTMEEIEKAGGVLWMKEQRIVEQEREEALAALLTPEELFEYNLRMSESADFLRTQFSMSYGFELTEEEFRKLFRLRESFDKEFQTFLGGTPPESIPEEDHDAWYDRRSEEVGKLHEDFEETLGEARFREYQHGKSFRRVREIAEEFEIAHEDFFEVFDATNAAEEAAKLIRESQNLTKTKRQAALDRIRAETENEVKKIIGDQAAQSYIEKGYKIRNLNVLPDLPDDPDFIE